MAKGRIRAVGNRRRISDQTDSYIDLLRAVFTQAVEDVKASKWDRYAPAMSWLKAPEIQKLAMEIDIYLPDPTTISAIAERKRRCGRKEAQRD